MVLKIVWGFAIVLVLCAIYVRIAPTDIEKWHRKVDDPRDKSFQAGVIRVLPGAADQFNELQQIALSTPRTKVFAGSVEDLAMPISAGLK